MKKLTRFLSYLTLILSFLARLHPKGGWASAVLYPFKVAASTIAPLLTVTGSLSALLSLLHKDARSFWAGLSGAALAAQHVASVTQPHTGFNEAFGSDWQARLSPQQRARMLPRRYTPTPPALPSAQRRCNIRIGTHTETDAPLLADLWLPQAATDPTGLGIVYLHGGAWHYLHKDAGTRRFFRHLTGQGHIVLDVEYTMAPEADLYGTLADIKRAIAWLKTQGPPYGVDTETVVLMGGSAGGQLALLAAYTPNHPKLQPADVQTDTSVRAVVAYYPLPNLTTSQTHLSQKYRYVTTDEIPLIHQAAKALEPAMRRVGFLPSYGTYVAPPDYIADWLGGTPEEIPDLYRLASPIHHVGDHCPPTLLIQGTHDLGGMLPDVRRLHDALRRAGSPSIYTELPEINHTFDIYVPRWAPAFQAATYDVERFLALMLR